MPVIAAFGGLVPRQGDDQAPVGAARVARDLWLSDGGIRPWRTPAALRGAPADARCFHVLGCDAAFWDRVVRVSDWLPDAGPWRFLAGRSWAPEVMIGQGDPEPLAVPAPETAPVVSCTEAYGEDCDARSYVYTWINRLGWESAPSPASRSVSVRDGDSVLVDLGTTAPEGIVAARLYRTATAWRQEGTERDAPFASAWLRVAELPGSTATFFDNVLLRRLGPTLETGEDRPPPEGMSHILRLEDTGVLVGAVGHMVHFSYNYRPWVWPARLDVALSHRIVNIGAVGTTVFATTEGHPATIVARGYCADDAVEMPFNEIEAAPPDVAMSHARSVASTPYGLVYSSPEGLILLAVDGSFRILTASWFDKPSWSAMRPETARMAWWRGRVVCATDEATLVLEIDAKNFGDSDGGLLTTLSLSPKDMQVLPTGELAMLVDDEILLFDRGDAHMRWAWESAPVKLGSEATFTAMRVLPRGATVTLKGRRGESWTGEVPDGGVVRPGRLGRSDKIVVRLEGDGPVDRFELAASIATLAGGDA